ncbi:MAG: S41 family peptidase [Myxococcota bacterium]
MKVLLVVLLGCRTKGAVEAAAPPSLAPADELRAFAGFVLDTHPEPFRFVDPEAFEAVVAEEATALESVDAPDQFEVGRAFQRVIATLGDVHVQVALPVYQPDATLERSLFPLVPQWDEGRVMVDGGPLDWPVGTELLSIDGMPAPALWEELAAMVSADGRRADAQRAALEHDFAKYLHLRIGMRPTYPVVARLPDGTSVDVALDGMTAEAYRTMRVERAGHPPDPRWPHLSRPEPGVAWLQLPSFGNPDAEAYTDRVDGLLDALDSVDTLVIDVRGNLGGIRTHGVAVLNRVLSEPYTQWRAFASRVPSIAPAHRPFVEFLYADERVLERAYPGVEGDPLAERMQPPGPGFEGDVVLFADERTNSAANELALALVRHRPDTLFVGREIGGDCDRHNGEVPVLYRTSNTGLVVLMSLFSVRHVEVEGCVPGRGLMPDVIVPRETKAEEPYWTAYREHRRPNP